MNEQFVQRILIVGIVHQLLGFEISFNSADVFLKIFSFLFLAFEVWSVFLDPLTDQFLTRRLVYQMKSIQNDFFIQREVSLFDFFFHECESVYTGAYLLDGHQIPLQDYQ